jgi:hypothetical protein
MKPSTVQKAMPDSRSSRLVRKTGSTKKSPIENTRLSAMVSPSWALERD